MYDKIPRKPKIGSSQAKYVETNIGHSKFAHVHKMQGNSIHNFHHRGKINFASDLDVAIKNPQLVSGKATMYFCPLPVIRDVTRSPTPDRSCVQFSSSSLSIFAFFVVVAKKLFSFGVQDHVGRCKGGKGGGEGEAMRRSDKGEGKFFSKIKIFRNCFMGEGMEEWIIFVEKMFQPSDILANPVRAWKGTNFSSFAAEEEDGRRRLVGTYSSRVD